MTDPAVSAIVMTANDAPTSKTRAEPTVPRGDDMPPSLSRALFGFVAAVISVLTFHQGMWELLHLLGLMPPWYPTRGVECH